MTSVRLTWSLLPIALAVASAFPVPAHAAGDAATQELLKELRALKDRVVERLLDEALQAAAEITAWKMQRGPGHGLVHGRT